MKIILAMAIVLSATFAQARVIKAGTVQWDLNCKTKDNTDRAYSIQLTTLKDAQDLENQKVPASLTITPVYPLGVEVMPITKKYAGVYTYEDVVTIFSGTSNKGPITFKIYADELDQNSLTVAGVRTPLDCLPNN